MEEGPIHSGDSSLPRSLTDSDFQALSLEVAQARADARGAFLRRSGEAVSDGGCRGEGAHEDEAQVSLPREEDGASSSAELVDEFIQQRLPSEDFAPVHCNLSIAELMEHALLRAEGVLSDRGALCVRTLPYSGITPGSYFCVEPPQPSSDAALAGDKAPIHDKAPINNEEQPEFQPGLQLAPLDESAFWGFYRRAVEYSEDKALYQCDGQFQGEGVAQAASPPGLRIICELASQAIMARHWLGPWEGFRDDPEGGGTDEKEAFEEAGIVDQAQGLPGDEQSQGGGEGHSERERAGNQLEQSEQELTVIVLPGLKGEPWLESLLETEVFVLIHPAQRLALVGGSRHGGDLRQAIAALFAEVQAADVDSAGLPSTPLLCQDAVQLEHGSGQRSLFLGALGSGKQTLAAAISASLSNAIVPSRGPLLSQAGGLDGLQPLLLGGYGNVTGLDSDSPLQQRLGFGAVLENVPLQETSSRPRFGDLASAIPFWATWQDERRGLGQSESRARTLAHRLEASSAVFLLVADVKGVLPAIARLTREQALYYFALGYGAELPGWNRHQLSPAAHFTAMDRARTVRDVLRWRDGLQAQSSLAQGETSFYLVNTGWLGPMEHEGRSLLQRIPVSISEAFVKAASSGDIPLHDPALSPAKTCLDPVFGWTLPLGLPHLSGRWCQPWNVWGNVQHWRAEAIALVDQFQAQMAQLVAAGLPPEIAQAGPCPSEGSTPDGASSL